MLKKIWTGLKQFWAAWTRVAKIIGNFQARVMLTVLYAVAVAPFGILVRLLADPLRIKHRPEAWLDRPAEVEDMQWAQKQ
jgi:hypothetical protein